jgi:hypothetical protein
MQQDQRNPSRAEFARQSTPGRRLFAPTPTNALRNCKEKRWQAGEGIDVE